MSLNGILKDAFTAGDGIGEVERVSAVRKLLIKHKTSDEYKELLPWLFPELLKMLNDSTGTGNLRVICSDTLAICLLRASQLTTTSPEFLQQFRQVLLDEDRLNTLFNYIVDYWDESGAPLSNSLKDLFTKLISLLNQYDFSQQLFERWTDISLEIRKERRALYYLVETFSKELADPNYILRKDPSFIEESLSLISSNALGNLIGKSIAAILRRLYTNEEEADQWVVDYWSPIKVGIQDTRLRPGIVSNLLPHLFKQSTTAFKSLVNEFKHDVEVFITFLNIGQQLSIEEDPYPNLVDEATIQNLLTHNDFKVKVFQVLTFSPKGSKTVSCHTLEILKSNLELFLVDTEVETRNEFISLFRQFLYRIKDSGYALNRDANKLLAKNKFIDEAKEKLQIVETYKQFLIWLIDLIKFQLVPGSQYQRVVSGLKILQQIIESNLDPDAPFEVEIPHAFQISILRDAELTRLLFNNVLSTYDDIREISSRLLILSRPPISIEEKAKLINQSFDLLNDYGKSESGAKFLQLCHSLFEDDSIYSRLMTEIPLSSNIFEAVNHPVDGYFRAMSLIIPQIHERTNINPDKVIQLIETNWGAVKDILSHDSPEGCDQYGVGSAQLVLSYGWRSVKEATLLMTQLLEISVFTADKLIKIGELLLDQLSSVRHRGAFSSVYPTFLKLASICAKHIPGQNQKWLDFNISLIQTKTQLITRRSGGLPFLIAAIVTVDRDLFKYAFDKLLEISREPIHENEESEKMDLPQIHAFNCIKVLFIESQLSNSCAPYIFDALSLSLTNFSSKIWSVRNCSIMLFTALQNRLFGYKTMSARVFFSRFKGIKEILIDILRDSTNGDNGNLEALFPVLTILSKLESTPGYDGLSEFQPLLRSCLAAKYWKVRECAARALPALVPCFKLEALLLLESCSISKQNQLHGNLLAIKKLLENIELADANELVHALIQRSVELLIYNSSHVTKKVYLEILKSVWLKNHSVIDLDLLAFLKDLFIQDNELFELDGSKQLYLKTLFNLICSCSKDDDLLALALSSPFFEVKLEAIQYCSTSNITHSQLTAVAQDETEWIYVRSKAIQLVSDFSIDKAFDFVENQRKFGEDIKCSGLKLSGSLVSQIENGGVFGKWFQLLISNSDDDKPPTIRTAALVSALRYLKLKKHSKVEYLAYKFLSDDDEEIRALASSYFSEGTAPFVNAKKFVENTGKSQDLASVIVEEVLNFKFNSPDTTTTSLVLFAIEKKNFYRNNIEQIIELSQMLHNSWDLLSCEAKGAVISHIDEQFRDSIQFIKSAEKDDILGWSNNEDIFEQLYSIFYLKKQHGTQEDLKTLDADVHPTLHSLLA